MPLPTRASLPSSSSSPSLLLLSSTSTSPSPSTPPLPPPLPLPLSLPQPVQQRSLEQGRRLQQQRSTTTEWKQHQHQQEEEDEEQHQQQHQRQRSITAATSTSSLASTTFAAPATGNQPQLKMEIISQGKCLCGHYIRARLRRAGVLNRKAVQRLRKILEPSSDVVYDVFPALNCMGEELERMHARVYTNVARQLSRAPYGELEDNDSAPVLLNLVAKELFRTNITWGKVVSIFAVCGGFAIDCVRQGHYDYLQYLIDGIAEIVEDDLVQWMAERGGWTGLQHHIRPQTRQISSRGLTLFVTISSGVCAAVDFLKNLVRHLYSVFS